MKKFPYYDIAKEFNDAIAKAGFYDKAPKTQAQAEIAAARERDIARAAATTAAREREQAERVRMMDEEDRRRIEAERAARDTAEMVEILRNYPSQGGTLAPAVERRLREAGQWDPGLNHMLGTQVSQASINVDREAERQRREDNEWRAITAPWANDPPRTQAEIDRKIAEGVAAELARQKKNDLAVAPPEGSGRRRLPA